MHIALYKAYVDPNKNIQIAFYAGIVMFNILGSTYLVIWPEP